MTAPAGAAAGTSAAGLLAELGDLGTDVDVVVGRPDPVMLADEAEPPSCERCGLLSCPMAALVSWPISERQDATGLEFIRVGRGCVRDAVENLGRVYGVAAGGDLRVTVECPAWPGWMAAGAARVGDDQLVRWTADGHLRREDVGVAAGEQVWLADMVVRARRIGELVRAGVRADEAAALVTWAPARARVVLAALVDATGQARQDRAVRA